ncbi:MAG: sigma-70 family RNA polymerase sigma factor [Thermoanaerobacterales bacterium]|nr:sigma-70 family RNA polymerase sigma factor [Bacillota bacterium]MDI6906403.1 sigma-70 family RNA polymerase sigma factor [Thermoanaerobacterales bacterium]
MDRVRLLVQKSQDGDTGAFEELVTLYQDRVYALSYRLTGNGADAQDLAQETFVKAYTGLKGFRNQADFGTWLHRITVNLWINARRRERPSVSLDAPVQTADGEVQRVVAATAEEDPAELAERAEFRQAVQAALRDLSREHRAVLVLREMQGYNYDEIARVMDCSLGTVKSRLNRARQALKDKLAHMLTTKT